MPRGGSAQAGAEGRRALPRAAGPPPTTRAGGGEADQVAARRRRVNGMAVDRVPGRGVARSPDAGSLWRPARGHIVVPRIGLSFPRHLPFDAWLGVGAQLAAVTTSSAWCLGDWLIYGQSEYGSRYREAAERTGLEYQTMRNYAWVAGQFELSRRRDKLSFGHHAEVAALSEPEQDFWLRKAEEFRWSTMRLRNEVRASLAERGLEQAGPPRHPKRGRRAERQARVQVTLTFEQLELCEQAASQDGLTLHAWAVQVLEHAALDRLPPR